jgi:hypothetical protein
MVSCCYKIYGSGELFERVIFGIFTTTIRERQGEIEKQGSGVGNWGSGRKNRVRGRDREGMEEAESSELKAEMGRAGQGWKKLKAGD